VTDARNLGWLVRYEQGKALVAMFPDPLQCNLPHAIVPNLFRKEWIDDFGLFCACPEK
jgi:hypothetical protein